MYKVLNESPPNTIFALGMNSLTSGEMTTFYYSGFKMKRSDIVELVRQVEWDLIIVDESHKVRNPQSNAYQNLSSLFRGAPKIVQMTGTYITDTIMDVWKQGSLLDPGIFGSETQFKTDFYRTVGKTEVPRPGAEAETFRRLEEVADVLQIRRVEWAAWLPKRIDEFEPTGDLNETQRQTYEALFHIIVGYNRKNLPDHLSDLERFIRDDPDDDSQDGDDGGEGDDRVIGYPLSNLERFLSSMDFDTSPAHRVPRPRAGRPAPLPAEGQGQDQPQGPGR